MLEIDSTAGSGSEAPCVVSLRARLARWLGLLALRLNPNSGRSPQTMGSSQCPGSESCRPAQVVVDLVREMESSEMRLRVEAAQRRRKT